ncbi:hypothetical protein [Bifidobacterium longum]|uniref:hypothetical protein n=1 Tax=Bifidobacterium longum TaxID=216816 RepID=UPI001F600A75|nr:hypothetical protein [Bifidobacterium longum]
MLNELRELVRVKVNLFTPSKKPVGRASARDGRPRRVYDAPHTARLARRVSPDMAT